VFYISQLCVISLGHKFYIMNLFLNQHQPTPYDTKDAALAEIDLQEDMCDYMCSSKDE